MGFTRGHDLIIKTTLIVCAKLILNFLLLIYSVVLFFLVDEIALPVNKIKSFIVLS